MPGKYDMGRRDFLKNSSMALGTLAIVSANPMKASSPEVTDPKPVNEGPVYDLAKKVWNLSREAWYPERYKPLGGWSFYNGVIGVLNLNLASTLTGPMGPGYYIKIRSKGSKDASPESDQSSLELMVVNNINQKTTKVIDKYLSNLGLKYHLPTMDAITQKELERILKTSDEKGIGITRTAAAVIAIWNKKILGYAKKHKLPVLYLASGYGNELGSLDWVGIKNGYEPRVDDHLHLTELKLANIQRQIIEKKYIPILTKTIPALEKEIERVKSLRSGENLKIKRAEERLALEEAKKLKKILEETELKEKAEIEKEKNRLDETVQRILEYQTQ